MSHTEEDFKKMISDIAQNIGVLAEQLVKVDDLVPRLGDKADKAYEYLNMANSQLKVAISAAKVGLVDVIINKLKSHFSKESDDE